MTFLLIQGHKIPYWKALRYGKDESRGLRCGSTFNVHQDLLKSCNLLHKRGFVDSQSNSTICKISSRLLPCKTNQNLTGMNRHILLGCWNQVGKGGNFPPTFAETSPKLLQSSGFSLKTPGLCPTPHSKANSNTPVQIFC